MKTVDMARRCCICRYYQLIQYADGSNAIGCLAYNVKSAYPQNIKFMDHCPLGKYEKK